MIYQCWKTTISKKCDSRVIRLHLFMFLAALAMCATSCIFTQEGDARFVVGLRGPPMRNMVQGPWESVEGWQRPEVRDGDKPWAKPCLSLRELRQVHLGNVLMASVPTSRNGGDVVSVFFCGLRWFGTVSAHCGYSYKKKDRCIARIA